MKTRTAATPTQTLFIGIFFLLIGLAIAYFGTADAKLSCARSSNLCTIEKTNIWIFKNVKHINLSDLLGAQVESSRFSDGHGGSIMEVVLITKAGIIPVASSNLSDRLEQENDCQKVNQFISSREENLEIVYSGLLIIKLFGLFLAWAGLLLILNKNGTTKRTAKPVDKFIWVIAFFSIGLAILYYWGLDTKLSCIRSSNLCTIEKTNIFGFKNLKEIKLSDLTGAAVESSYRPASSSPRTYKIVLLTQNGKIVLIPDSVAIKIGPISFTSEDCQEIDLYIHSQYEKLEKIYSSLGIRIFGLIFIGLGVLLMLVKTEDITVY